MHSTLYWNCMCTMELKQLNCCAVYFMFVVNVKLLINIEIKIFFIFLL